MNLLYSKINCNQKNMVEGFLGTKMVKLLGKIINVNLLLLNKDKN